MEHFLKVILHFKKKISEIIPIYLSLSLLVTFYFKFLHYTLFQVLYLKTFNLEALRYMLCMRDICDVRL